MNEREKKLIFILFGAAFLIVNVFLFTSYKNAMTKKKAALAKGKAEIQRMVEAIEKADDKHDDVEWLRENQPAEGIHSEVRSNLAVAAQRSAQKYGVEAKAPKLEPETVENGAYGSATVTVKASARDRELYLWLVDLQDPKSCRAITSLKIFPQRGPNPERVDCEIEITQWFTPKLDDESVTSN